MEKYSKVNPQHVMVRKIEVLNFVHSGQFVLISLSNRILSTLTNTETIDSNESKKVAILV